MIRSIIYSLAAIMMLCSRLLAAETRSFQIELMVFTQNLPNSEIFDQTVSHIEWPDALTEQQDYPRAEHMMLDESHAALAKNSAYRPTLHIAWIQSIPENSPGSPVHIQNGSGEINGYLQIQRGQTLQLLIDLEYSPAPADNNGQAVIYRLNEKRPFQLNDTHYFDHPRFGAITKITTVDKLQ